MPILSRGAALIDPTGGLLASDAGFVRALGLSPADAAASLRARAGAEPALAALLAGEGPESLALHGAAEALRLERHRAPGGLLLVLRADGDAERLEHAARSQGLALLAGGLSHDVNGPLHAMTLQLALLEEKLGDGAPGQLAAGHLRALRDQVARVNRLVRRFREIAEPAAAADDLDLGALASDVLALLGHDLHRREIRLELSAAAGAAPTSAPADRAARLVLGLLQQAAAATPARGALSVTVDGSGEGATLTIVHTHGGAASDLGYYSEVAAGAAAALGGRLARSAEDGRERVTLELPGGRA